MRWRSTDLSPVWCWLFGDKAECCSVMWFLLFFFSSSEVERQEQSGGGGPVCLPTGRGCNVVVPFPPHYCLFLARSDIFHSNLSFAMAGAIIENMSTKKLVIVGVILLLFQAFAFMVGGLIGKFSLFLSLTFSICLANVCLWTSFNG